ncbi:MAG: hypothetical protein WBH40_10250 [Ignavibacteriaceae bacterium]|jgi:hypothetical protein
MKNFLIYICFFLLGATQLYGQNEVGTELVGRWAAGPPYAFTVENNIVFTASGGILQTLDISDPSNPILIGQVATNGIINDVAKSGNYIYLAEGDSGLKIIDVTNLTNPVQVNEYLQSYPILKFKVENQTLFITEGKYDESQWTGGLRILDISDPISPQPLGFFASSRPSYFISPVDNYIYMSYSSDETFIIDVSDLTIPILAGSIYTRFGYSYLSGNLLYVAGNYPTDEGLKIFDVSNPSSPILLSHTIFPGCAEDINLVIH